MPSPEPANTTLSEADSSLITVEVAYALADRQSLKVLRVRASCTALEAVIASGIAQDFAEIDPATADMGIFSKNLDGKMLPLPAEYRLKAGDRVEIYRPLIADPKAARQQRAARAKAAKASRR